MATLSSAPAKRAPSPPQPTSGSVPSRRATALVYAAAVLLYAWRYYCAPLSNENTLTGSMAQGVLAGHFPYFFHGQNWMGGLDALILAPLFAVFGPSSWLVNLLPPLLSLGSFIIIHRLLSRMLSPAATLAGLVFLAAPPASALFWVGHANVHYPLAVFLGAGLLLLTCRLWERPAWGAWAPLLWGLTAGAAFYTNFQSLVFIAPAGLFLLAARPGRLFRGGLPWMLIGAVIGAAPLLYYNYTHDWTHLSQTGSFALQGLIPYLQAWFYNAMPMMLGFNTPASGGSLAPGSPLFILYLLWLAGAAAGALLLLKGALQKTGRLAWLPLGVGFFNLAVLVGSNYGGRLSGVFLSYLLPFMWLCLPFCWGALGQVLARRHWGWAALLGLALVVNNAAAYPAYQRGPYKALSLVSEHQKVWSHFQRIGDQFRAAGIHHVYTMVDSLVLSLAAGDDPVFAHPWNERVASRSVRVDAAPNAAFWTNRLEASYRMLGLKHERVKIAGRWAARRFQPPRAAKLISRGSWRARSLDGRDLGRALNDGAFNRGFVTKGAAQPGQGFLLDLGREQLVSGVSLIPLAFNQTPAGLLLEGAGRDGVMTVLRRVQGYWGPFYLSGPHPMHKVRFARVECYFPPRKIRYLKFTHLGRSIAPWSVAEVLAFGPGPQDSRPPDWAASAARLTAVLNQERPRKALADAWASAVIRLGASETASVIANQTQDDFGERSPSYRKPLELDIRRGNALAVLERDADDAAAMLASSGAAFTRRRAGALALFLLKGRETGPPITIRASRSPRAPRAALILDLGRPAALGWLEIDAPDYAGARPRGLKAQVSNDGETWSDTPLHPAAPLCFTGQVLLTMPGPRKLYRLAKTPRARYLKLVGPGYEQAFRRSARAIGVLGP